MSNLKKSVFNYLKDKEDGMYEYKTFIVKKGNEFYTTRDIVTEVKEPTFGVKTIKINGVKTIKG